MEKKLKSVKGYKLGDRVLTQDAFGRSYIGTVDGFTSQTISNHKVVYIRIKDSEGKVIERNVKYCQNLSN
jgi:hypothetical protein